MCFTFNPHQTEVSESLIRRRGAKWPTRGNQLYRLYFAFQATKTISRDSKDTRADSHRVRDQPWSFHGPCRAPKIDGPGHYNFQAYFRVCIPFPYCSFCSPSNNFGTLFWSLWNSIRAQGTLLDLHIRQDGPQNGPYEANFRGSLIEKGPPASLHGPK